MLFDKTADMKNRDSLDPFLTLVELADQRVLMDIHPADIGAYQVFYQQRFLGEILLDSSGQPWAVHCAKQFSPKLEQRCPQLAGLLLNRQVVSRVSVQISKALQVN